jgi:hypothetical protein
MTKRILPPDHAWYLYGIAQRSEAESGLPRVTVGVDGASMVAMIECGELVALVSAVPLAEFAAERVRSLAQDDLWLERVAREHARVVDALQRCLTIVPARLFSVYASDDDICASLAASEPSILRTLQRLAGCDEFEIRLTFDRAALRKSLSRSVPEIAGLVEQRTASSPGRAYLVDRQIAALLKRKVEETIEGLGGQVFAEFRSRAVAYGALSPLRLGEGDTALAVVRRAYLVRRAQQDRFLDAVVRIGLLHPETKIAYSGPWPPYNFVDPDVLEEQGSIHR